MPPEFASLPRHLEDLRAAALQAVDPERAVRRHLSMDGPALICGEARLRLKPGARAILVGAGKAGVPMARAAADVLGGRLSAGVVAVPQPPSHSPPGIEFVPGGHPTPTEGSLEAGRKIAALLRDLSPDDVVIVLISGGGSALMELPVPGLTLDDLRAITAALLRSGATINELNTVRRALSQIKGGGLARLAAPAQTLALILSDVVGDPLEVIASGPTVPNPTTLDDARRVLERYGVAAGSWTEDRGRTTEERPLRGTNDEGRPTTDQPPAFVHRPSSFVRNLIIGSNAQAAEAAAARARALGFDAMVLSTFVEGEAREVGRVIAGLGKGVRRYAHPIAPPACLVLGGETTVTVRGSGKGGRNQELALAAGIALDGWDGIAVMSFGTDGIDGPTDAAGAFVTGDTLRRARAMDRSARTALDANDAYPFFSALGDLIVTGPTGTNVNDLMLVLVY